MKKIPILAVAVLALAFMASCDSKLCYCYTPTATTVYEDEVYTGTDNPCSALSNASRTCVEREERMNPGDIAHSPGKH